MANRILRCVFCLKIMKRARIKTIICMGLVLACLRLVYLELFPKNTVMLKYIYTSYKRIHFINQPHYISRDVFADCQYSCYATNSSLIDDAGSDVIVVWRDLKKIPPKKPRNQVWVYFNMEPPTLQETSYELWRKLFNWTISYRRDSDIYSPYGIFSKHETNLRPSTDFSWNDQLKDVVWLVSNCNTSSMRHLFVAELNKTIPVDVYGKCGTDTCAQKWLECVKMLQGTYKYYLSFENSLCRDYITEKSFKIYESEFNAIPVVRNGANSSLYLPPRSYISTSDSDSIADLGKFMKILSNTKITQYLYFDWRRHYTAMDTIDCKDAFCELCRRAHTHDKYVNIYEDFDDWLRGPIYNRFCERPMDIQGEKAKNLVRMNE